MAEHFLDRADIVVCLQEVRGEGIPEGVGRDALSNSRFPYRVIKGFLNMSFMNMITPLFLRFLNARQ